MNETLKWFLESTFLNGKVVIALAIMFLIVVLSFIVFLLARKANPLEEHKGLLGLFEMAIEKIDKMVHDNMGEGFKNFGGYVLSVAMFILLCFIVGITGLPNPLTNINFPLILAFCTFVFIHATSIRFTKWGYFKRYVEPIAPFLPVNLISMWGPLLSLTLRLFGNAVSGWVLMTLVYWGLGNLSSAIFSFAGDASGMFIAPIIAPFLHAYFDLFSGAIQMYVFIFLSMLFVAQEKPDDVKLASHIVREIN